MVGGRVADAGGKVRSGWEGSRGQEDPVSDPGVVRGEAVVVMVIAIEMQRVGGGGGVARIFCDCWWALFGNRAAEKQE